MITRGSGIKVASGIAREIETIKIDTAGTEITIDHEKVGTGIVKMIDIVREINIDDAQGAGALIKDADIETSQGAHQGKTSVEDRDHHADVMIKRNRKTEALDSIRLRKKTKFLR